MLRLTTLLWRLRRATTIEIGLFEIEPEPSQPAATMVTLIIEPDVEFDAILRDVFCDSMRTTGARSNG